MNYINPFHYKILEGFLFKFYVHYSDHNTQSILPKSIRLLKASLVYLHEILAMSVLISNFFAFNKPRTFIWLIGQCMKKMYFWLFWSKVDTVMLCHCLLCLPLLPLNIFLGAGRSCQCFILFDMTCVGPFSEILHSNWLQPSAFFRILFSSGSALCVFFSLSLWMLDISSMWTVGVLFGYRPVSIVDRAIIWKILKRTRFQCIF